MPEIVGGGSMLLSINIYATKWRKTQCIIACFAWAGRKTAYIVRKSNGDRSSLSLVSVFLGQKSEKKTMKERKIDKERIGKSTHTRVMDRK